MSVECTGRNIEVTASLRELARRQTLQLERRLGGPATVRVVLSHEKHRFGAEVIASHRRRHWKAQEETAGDPRAAVTLAFEDRPQEEGPRGGRTATAGDRDQPKGQDRARRARKARGPAERSGDGEDRRSGQQRIRQADERRGGG